MRIAGYKVVHVKWIDSSSCPGWHGLDKDIDLSVDSIGFLIYKDDARVVLTKSIAPDSTGVRSYHSQMHIPCCSIKQLRYL
jgi:hypothetical protein